MPRPKNKNEPNRENAFAVSAVRVLAIDGGGIRGVIPAVLLAELERRAERPVAELFDLIAGTSTGGILAAALTVPGPDGRPRLTAAEVALLSEQEREFRLRDALASVVGLYHFVLIDCPPSINMLTVNALTAASGVLIPIQCEYYALEGLTALLRTVDQVQGSVNPKLMIYGILRTMFDPRNNLANEVSAQLMEHFGDAVYRTVIPRNVRLAEAPSFGKPALYHDKYSRGALAYLALAGEINRRETALAQAQGAGQGRAS